MDRPSGSGSAPSRPRSVSPVSESNVNVFDDEFAEDYAESFIAPSIRNDGDPFSDSYAPSDSDDHLPLPPTDPTPSGLQTPPLQRNSIRKPRREAENNALSHGLDQLQQQNGAFSAQRGSMAHRTNSTSSLAPPLSPTDDSHGPSHPYAMYPQVQGISRTASIATASTIRSPASQSRHNPNGPTHPYALYPQDTFGDSDESSTTIPVGFPGHVQNFRRRMETETEEQEIIGLDGHAEQLPPYTRYPETALTKAPGINGGPLPRIGEASHSRDNLVDMQEVSNVQTLTESGDNGSQLRLTQTEPPAPEKSWKDKSWKEKRQHRLCGIVPLWIILLAFAVIVIIVTICVGVIVGYVEQEQSKTQKTPTPTPYPYPQETGTPPSEKTTSFYLDANPITATTGHIPPVPTGLFDVQFGSPDTKYNACLNRTQNKAWSCDLPFDDYLTFSITNHGDKWFLDTITGGRERTQTYGTQPPELNREILKLVIDIDERKLGAAYHFQTFYDKLVVVPAGFLSQETAQLSSLSRLWPRTDFLEASAAQFPPIVPGDQAWFCRWDDTFIEGFIYVSESHAPPSSSSTTTTTTTNSATTTPITPTGYTSTPTTPSVMPPPTSPAGKHNLSAPAALAHDSVKALARRHRPLIYFQPWQLGGQYSSPPPTGYSTPPLYTPPITSGTSTPSTSPSTTPASTTAVPSYMPNLVKFEERRLAGTHGTPLCTLYDFHDDGRWGPYFDNNENLVQIVLEEDDGGNWLRKYRYRLSRRDSDDSKGKGGYQADLDDTCYCQWTSFKDSKKKS